MPDYVIQQGDCLTSLAAERRLSWQQIWQHPRNSTLVKKRANPNILLPGDVLFIPDVEEKLESRPTEQRHRFSTAGALTTLRLRLLVDRRPRAAEPYTLSVCGKIYRGKTDQDGKLEVRIPAAAAEATLTLGENAGEYRLLLGHLDPIAEVSGVKGRLANLGFDCGPVDGILGPRTREAIRDFQHEYQLEKSGQPDDPTRKKLAEIYGS